MKHLLTAFAAVLLLCEPAAAQQLAVSPLDVSAFPTVEAGIFVFDSVGRPLRTLSVADFAVTEDNIPRPVTLFSCPPSTPEPISAVLMLDVSSSMNEPAGNTRLDVVKSAAAAFAEALSDGVSECAIGSFDDFGYVNQDFTTDRAALLSAISRLKPMLGTNYDEALLTPPAGALEIARTGKYKKVVIFLTDGLGAGSEQAIIAKATSIGVTMYCITAGLSAPPVLQNISTQTGGAWFENITSKTEAIAVFRTIFGQSAGYKPCKLRWQSGVGCPDTNRVCNITVPARGLSAIASYIPPSAAAARLVVSPAVLSFGAVPPGNSSTLTFTLTAQGAAFTIRSITPSLSIFQLLPQPAFPFVLTAGTSRQFSVRFSPVDSFFRAAKLLVETDLCPTDLHVRGGFPGKFPVPPDLVVRRPNGGESFVVGTTELLEWNGVAPDDSVTLEYTTDSGASWNVIAKTAGLRYRWRVPDTPSGSCLLRATHAVVSSGGATKIRTLSGHTNTVQGAAIAPDGSPRAVTASSDGTGIIWNTATGAQVAVLNGHSGILYSAAFSADGTRIITGGSDNTARIWNSADGSQTQLLTGHTAPTLDAALSPDGLTAATGYDDGAIRIWNVPLESTTRVIAGHTARVYDLDFHPVGQTILSASGDRTARLWNPKTGAELTPPFSLHGNSVRACAFAPDGLQIATGGSDAVVYIWDTLTRTPLHTLNGHSAPVLSLAWSPEGSRLLTGGADGRVVVWDAVAGTEILALPPYSEPVTSVGWNASGDTIIVASGNTADLWTIRAVASQRDISDSLWAIVSPQVTPKDVDFGRLVVGASRDSVVRAMLVNPGSYAAEISGVIISGLNPSDFSVLSGGAPFSLGAGRQHDIELRFRPSGTGARSASVLFITNYGDTLSCFATGEGVQPAIVLETPLIDFGVVEVGRTKDTVVPVIVRNIGSTAVLLSPTPQLGPDIAQFSVINPAPFMLQPSGVHPLTLRYSPQASGRTSGRLGLEFSEPGSPVLVRLFGRGLGGVVSLPEDSAFAGERRNLALMLSGVKPTTAQGGNVPVKFTAEVEYDGSILTCNSPEFSPVRFVRNGELRERLSISQTWDGVSGELAVIPVVATLGITETTTLGISSFVWRGAAGDSLPVKSEVRAGKFKLLGICEADGKRFYRPERLTALMSAAVQGNEVIVSYSAGEAGGYSVEAFDAMGRMLGRDLLTLNKAGDYTHSITLAGNPPLLLFMVLRSPTASIITPLFSR